MAVGRLIGCGGDEVGSDKPTVGEVDKAERAVTAQVVDEAPPGGGGSTDCYEYIP